MTLIVGILCKDGVVVGADGAATLGALGNRTIQQPVKKLTDIDHKLILGVSGAVGLSQRFTGAVTELWNGRKLSNKPPFEAMTIIRDALWVHAEKEMKAAATASAALGSAVALQSALTHSIIAMPVTREPCLLQFDQQCAPELATRDLPFVAVGSGQPLADPFLAFLRRIFWPRELPSVADGLFATVWSLQHAISIHPGGVSEPMQVMTLSKVGNDWQVTELGEADFAEHKEAIAEAERRLANFRTDLVGTGAVPAPPTA